MKIITTNRKAHFNYEILDTFEVGIVLTGDEVKSLRAGKVSLDEAFALVQQGELVLLNCYIGPYTHAYSKEDTSRRTRTLLAHRREIQRMIGDISRKGLTLIPLKLYFNQRGYIKAQIGLARHKKAHDKRHQLRERDIARETQREIKNRVG